MTTVLKINASGRTDGSVSRDMADRIAATLANGRTVVARDINAGLPALDATWIGATFTPADARTGDQRAALRLSDKLVAELQAADTIVIGTPVYNFGIPSTLKAWIDLIARAGVTFRYTENGPQGLLKGKKAVIAYASGGVPMGAEMDFVTPYLKTVLGFVGIADIEFIDAERFRNSRYAQPAAANTAATPIGTAA